MDKGQFKTRRPVAWQLLGFALFAAVCHAQDAATEPKSEFGVLLAPNFMGFEITRPVEGAKKTALVVTRKGEFSLRYYTKALWEAENLDWDTAWPAAMATADGIVDKLEIKWIRDDNDVALYAAIQSDNPFLSSALFSKKFLPLFEAQLGARVLVIVPDRSSIYVFPKFGGKLTEFAPGLAERYEQAVSKVSLEIFEVSESGCQVIGSIGS